MRATVLAMVLLIAWTGSVGTGLAASLPAAEVDPTVTVGGVPFGYGTDLCIPLIITNRSLICI